MSTLPTQIAPIPGDATTIRSKATRFAATADAILDAVSGLRTAIADTKAHQSLAMDQLAGNAEEVAGRLEDLEGRYREAAGALSGFAGDLETAQRDAQSLVAEHADAVHNEGSYDRQIAYYRDQREVTTDPVEAADINRHLISLTQRRDAQASHAASAHARFTRIVENLRQSGDTAATRMRDTANGDGFNDSLWDDFSGWVAEHAEILKAIHSILQTITMALSVLSFFIPVLAPFALAAAAITAGLSLVLAATGQISWVDFALDLLAVATMGVGAAATRTIGGVMTALKGTRVARLTAQGARSPLRSVTGSFNGVLRGRVPVKIGPLTIKNAPKIVETWANKGAVNAHFLRVAQSAKAGAGGPLDDLLLNIGRQEMAKLRLAGTVNLVAHQVDKAATTYVPAVLDALPDSVIDNLPDGWADFLHDGGNIVHEAATWRIGS